LLVISTPPSAIMDTANTAAPPIAASPQLNPVLAATGTIRTGSAVAASRLSRRAWSLVSADAALRGRNRCESADAAGAAIAAIASAIVSPTKRL
jgi:hypothetical protein